MTSLADLVEVVIGVDTHVHTHSAAAVDPRTGAVLGEVTVPATTDGYEDLVLFASEHGMGRAWAIEGTGSYGAGLVRHLERDQELVYEVERPERARRRHGAKSDPLDAIRAGREVLSREKLGTPRASGDRQALAVLVAARRSAVEAEGVAIRQIFGLVIAAPETVRARFRGKSLPAMVKTAAGLRVRSQDDTETRTTVTILRSLARRAQALHAEARDHEQAITVIVRSWRPDLLEQTGVGPIVAAIVLCAWSHPGRVRSEAAFARLAGAAPIEANSGQIVTRYRLNRAGDRQLNKALHTIVITRLRWDQTTRDYQERRIAQGKSKPEIRRCLKRYIARDLYRRLENPARALDAT